MANFVSKLWPISILKKADIAGYLFHVGDIGLFLQGARTDARVAQLRQTIGDHEAFEVIYRESSDPWASVNRKYRYQQRKYAVLMSLLPAGRRFQSALDLGCGLGDLSRLLADRSDRVLGLDVAQSVIDRARVSHGGVPGLSFDRADILDLPRDLDGKFDLVTIADSIYYLANLDDDVLKVLATRVAELLAPNGVCLLANHYFFGTDLDSKVSRRIHDAFQWSSRFRHLSDHWRPFYLVSLLTAPPVMASA